MNIQSPLIHHLCHLSIGEWVGEIPAHAQQNDFRFIVSPLKGVELGHGNENEQTRSLTLPSADPVFATQPKMAQVAVLTVLTQITHQLRIKEGGV